MTIEAFNEYPVRGSLKSLYQPLPIIPKIDPATDVQLVAQRVLSSLESALSSQNIASLASLFIERGSYWRDQLAFTAHLRTFEGSGNISKVLIELGLARQSAGDCKFSLELQTASLVQGAPNLEWISCPFTFETSQPEALCAGNLQLLPDGEGQWKIWILTTWLKDLKAYPERTDLLRTPSWKPPTDTDSIKLEVLIIGAGNAGLIQASRLKALDVKYLCIDKHDNIGDNWALRYASCKLHVRKGFAETPYLPYKDSTPDKLTRNDLAEQCVRLAQEFDLAVWNSTTIAAIAFDDLKKTYSVTLDTPYGKKTATVSHVIQATGIGSSVPYQPILAGAEDYNGVVNHSSAYNSAKVDLVAKGCKSVVVVGSANTAFDIIEDCYNAGLKTTMVERSCTYIYPMHYMDHPGSLGLWNILPAEVADDILIPGPLAIGAQIVRNAQNAQADSEPERYAALKKAGFLVRTKGDLLSQLYETGGGHYVDVGGTEYIASGKVGVVSNVSPVSYTGTGLSLSDGSELACDAILWCTGFRDKNVRDVAPGILGDGGQELANRMDACWALDSEGEIRGCYKRMLNLPNYWICGGFLSLQRYYSRPLALQIKASLEGILPEPYRDTPERPFNTCNGAILSTPLAHAHGEPSEYSAEFDGHTEKLCTGLAAHHHGALVS